MIIENPLMLAFHMCFILNLKIALFLQINVYSSMIKTKMMQAVTMTISWYVAW